MDEEASEQEDSQAVDRALASMIQPGRNAPLAKRLDGINVIDFSNIASLYASIPPHRKLLLLVILLAIKDKASEVRFEPWATEPEGFGLRLFYEVDGKLHESAPPPQYLAETIIREIKAVAGFYTIRRRLANLLRRLASKLDAHSQQVSQSHFQVKAVEDKIEISSKVYDSPFGDRVFLRFPNCPASLSERAQDALREIFDKRKA